MVKVGIQQNTEPWSTDPLLSPVADPSLTPYKINGKMKIKIGQNFQWLQFKVLNKLSLTETSKMVEALQIFNYLLF